MERSSISRFVATKFFNQDRWSQNVKLHNVVDRHQNEHCKGPVNRVCAKDKNLWVHFSAKTPTVHPAQLFQTFSNTPIDPSSSKPSSCPHRGPSLWEALHLSWALQWHSNSLSRRSSSAAGTRPPCRQFASEHQNFQWKKINLDRS